MANHIKPVDGNLVRDLASIGCTTREIAIVTHVSVDTLDRRFRKEIEEGWANLRQSLKRKQVEIALNGNIPMLIWLGKQYLEQRDVVEERIDHPDVSKILQALAKPLKKKKAAPRGK